MESKINTDLTVLNKQQDAVVSNDKQLLVLAGAGSGKTKKLLHKIIYLIEEKGINPSCILAIPFTKNAAGEMIDWLIISADFAWEYKKQLFDNKLRKESKEKERFIQQKKCKWIDGLTLKSSHLFCYSVTRNYGVNEFKIGSDKNTEIIHRET